MSNNISGRHANLAPEQGATTPDHPVDLPVARGPGAYGQPEKFHNKPHSGVGVSGLSGGICINESVHSLGETAEDKARCKANVGLPTGDSEGSGTVCWESCSYTESHPFSSITLLSSPNVNEFCPSPELHTGGGEQEMQDSSDTDRSLQGRSNLVGFIGTEPPGNTSLPTMPYSDSALRCIQQGLGGSSHAMANADRRSVVTGGSNSPYKLSGVVSSLPSNQSFREDLAGCHSINVHRQHHGSKLYKSERRHNLQATLPAGFVNLDLVQQTEGLPPGRTCTRAAQYTSRRGIQDCERPMLDAQPVSVSSNSDSNGGTGSGPVRLTSDSSASSLLQLEARPRGRGHGCIYAGLVSMQGLCQSPMVLNTSLSDQGQATSSMFGVNNTFMENSAVVSHSSGTTRRLSMKDSTARGPGLNVDGSGVSDAAGSTPVNRMAHLRKSYTS